MHQFTHTWNEHPARYWVIEAEAKDALKNAKRPYKSQLFDYECFRIAFRGIARNTDIRSMIATILPRKTYCSDMLQNCVVYRDKLNEGVYANDALVFLLGIWNSFTFDYILRQRITSRVSFHFLYQIPVPRLDPENPPFNAIATRAARLICTTPEFDDLAVAVGLKPKSQTSPHPNPPPAREGTSQAVTGTNSQAVLSADIFMPNQPAAPVPIAQAATHHVASKASQPPTGTGTRQGTSQAAAVSYGATDPAERAQIRAELDGLIAHLYGLTEAEFVHILATFPLVPAAVKVDAHNAYRRVANGLIS